MHTHHHHSCRDEKKTAALIARLRRIEGQIRGIARMIEGDEDCEDILIQLSAAKSATHKVAQAVLEDHLKHCVVDAIVDGNQDEAFEKLFSALDQFSKML